MPTIDIPDKICKHCGGIRYYVRYKNGKLSSKTCHNKMIATKKRNPEDSIKKAIRRHEWYLNNKEWENMRSIKWQKENVEKQRVISKKAVIKYQSSEKGKLTIKKNEKKRRLLLSNGYLTRLIVQDTDLKCLDIPQWLIETKRKELLLTRQIRNYGKESSSKTS